MSSVYSDYITLDGAARLARLRLYIQEISNKVSNPSISAGGYSRSENTGLSQLLTQLREEEKQLMRAMGQGVSHVRIARAR